MFNRRRVMRSVARSFAALAAFATSGVALPAWAKAAKSPLPKLGSVLPLPAVTLLDGRVWTPAELQGKTLVVYWWASWCPFCALQSPHIDALWRAQQANVI